MLLHRLVFRLCAPLILALCPPIFAQSVQAQYYPIHSDAAPHPEWRQQFTPLDGAKIDGPVTFIWPTPKKNRPEDMVDIHYDFTLSSNMDLSAPIVKEQHLPWAFYNSHRPLKAGRYYWQVNRYRDGARIETGKIHHFDQVGGGGFITPHFETLKANIFAERPRILADKQSARHFSEFKQSHPNQHQAFIDKAEGYFGITLAKKQYGGKFYLGGKQVLKNKKFPADHPKAKPTGRQFYKAIDALAKAYLLTGESRYGLEGIRWAMQVASFEVETQLIKQGVNHFPQDDFDIASLMPALAIALDSFYPLLTVEQKSALISALSNRAEGFYHYFRNRLETRVMDNHAWQHTFSDFFKSALALTGEHPKAEHYLRYAYGVWVARFPVQSITDGGWTNGKYVGVNVMTWNAMTSYLRRFAKVNYFEHPFFKNQSNWLMVRTPPQSWADGFGGDGFEEESGLKQSTAWWLNILNAEYQRPAISWYLKQWGYDEAAHPISWERMSMGLASAAPQADNASPSSLENSYLFQDTGVVNLIESWTQPATYVAFRSAPWGNFGHNLPSNNALNILYDGEPLLYPTGYRHGGKKHSYQWYRNSRAHNTLLVEGKGQPVSSEAFGYIRQYLSRDGFTFIQGDASHAYHGRPSPQWLNRFNQAGVNWYQHADSQALKRFRRNLIHIPPGIVIVYDEVNNHHIADVDWRFHSPKTSKLTDNGFLIEGERGQLLAHLYSGLPQHRSITDKMTPSASNVDGRKKGGKVVKYHDIGWHINVNQRAQNHYLLTLFDVGKKGQPYKKVTMNSNGEIMIGTTKIAANLSPNLPPSLTITLADGRYFELSEQRSTLSY